MGGKTNLIFCGSNQSCSFVLRKHDGALRISKFVLIRPKSEDVLTAYTGFLKLFQHGSNHINYEKHVRIFANSKLSASVGDHVRILPERRPPVVVYIFETGCTFVYYFLNAFT